MSSYVKTPILAIFGLVVSIIVIIGAVLVLSTTGVGGASSSTALVSTNSTLNALLPFLAVIMAGGITLMALSRKN